MMVPKLSYSMGPDTFDAVMIAVKLYVHVRVFFFLSFSHMYVHIDMYVHHVFMSLIHHVYHPPHILHCITFV